MRFQSNYRVCIYTVEVGTRNRVQVHVKNGKEFRTKARTHIGTRGSRLERKTTKSRE